MRSLTEMVGTCDFLVDEDGGARGDERALGVLLRGGGMVWRNGPVKHNLVPALQPAEELAVDFLIADKV